MNTAPQTLEDLVAKIDWEGGLDSALSYGVSSDDYELPDDVAEKLDELVDFHEEFETLEAEFWSLVRKHGVEF